MDERRLRDEVEAFVRQDLQPFFDSLTERAALSDDEYWERIQAGMKESPKIPEEMLKIVGKDFLAKENFLPRRRETDAQMRSASESLVRSKVDRALPFAAEIVAKRGTTEPLTRDEYEQAALKGSHDELRGTIDRLKEAAERSGDDRRGQITKRLYEIAEVDFNAMSSLGGSWPLTDEAVKEVSEGISARFTKLTEDIRAGKFNPPSDPKD